MELKWFHVDLKHVPYKYLVEPFDSWESKVVNVLHMIRCRDSTEYNPRIQRCVCTRFSHENIAFFDLDKESEVVHAPLFCEISPSQYYSLDDSANIISIKITESDVRYPIKVYGTVLARDQNDYRCVYLFRRGRDNPQLITRKNRMLDLTGPYRALNGTSFMFFEFHLKIKGKGAVDRDFSKGVHTCNFNGGTHGQLRTLPLESFLSRVELMYTPVGYALEASVGVNILNGISKFHGKIAAWTSGSDKNKINLYDSEVSSTKRTLGSGGSVSLSRHIVSVPLNEDLVLYIFARGWNNECKHLKLVLGPDVEEQTCKISTYVLQVKIIWKAVFRQERPHMWKDFGGNRVLWG